MTNSVCKLVSMQYLTPFVCLQKYQQFFRRLLVDKSKLTQLYTRSLFIFTRGANKQAVLWISLVRVKQLFCLIFATRWRQMLMLFSDFNACGFQFNNQVPYVVCVHLIFEAFLKPYSFFFFLNKLITVVTASVKIHRFYYCKTSVNEYRNYIQRVRSFQNPIFKFVCL